MVTCATRSLFDHNIEFDTFGDDFWLNIFPNVEIASEFDRLSHQPWWLRWSKRTWLSNNFLTLSRYRRHVKTRCKIENFIEDYVSDNREIVVIDNYFYISIYSSSSSSIRNQVAISLQSLYRTQIIQVRGRNEFCEKYIWFCTSIFFLFNRNNFYFSFTLFFWLFFQFISY